MALRRALHRDADVGLGDRPAVVGECDARRHLGRIDAENIAGGAMQADMAEVAGLVHAVLVVEEQPHAVGRVIALGLDLLVRDEGDVRIGSRNSGISFSAMPQVSRQPCLSLNFTA